MARRLRWQSARRRQALTSLLQQDLKAWLEGWSVKPQLLSLRLVDAAVDGEPDAEWRWWQASGKSGSLWFGARASQLDGLGGLLAGAVTRDSLGLGTRIGERALRALLLQLAGGSGNDVTMQVDELPKTMERDPRYGGCNFHLEGQGVEAWLVLDHDICEFRLPTPKPAAMSLAPLAVAVGSERVRLDVILDLGQASLAETQGLQVGDVLVSSTSLDSLFQLAQNDHRPLAGVRLFRREGLRALQVDSLIPKRATP